MSTEKYDNNKSICVGDSILLTFVYVCQNIFIIYFLFFYQLALVFSFTYYFIFIF